MIAAMTYDTMLTENMANAKWLGSDWCVLDKLNTNGSYLLKNIDCLSLKNIVFTYQTCIETMYFMKR